MKKHQFYYSGNVPFDEITLDSICGFERIDEGMYPVCNWLPRREDIQRIIEFAKSISNNSKPHILDIGSGNAFLSYLLAETNDVIVTALDPDLETVENSPYNHKNLNKIIGDSTTAKEIFSDINVDIVFNSWMPERMNLTPDIRSIHASGIVYILDQLKTTGQQYKPFFKSPKDTVSYQPGDEYEKIASWNGPENKEKMVVVSGIESLIKLCSNNYYTPKRNQIQFQLKKEIETPNVDEIEEKAKGYKQYAWEERADELFGEIQKIKTYQN